MGKGGSINDVMQFLPKINPPPPPSNMLNGWFTYESKASLLDQTSANQGPNSRFVVEAILISPNLMVTTLHDTAADRKNMATCPYQLTHIKT